MCQGVKNEYANTNIILLIYAIFQSFKANLFSTR